MKAKTGRRVHLAMMVVWLGQMIAVPFYLQGWKMYLLELSLYANLVGHWSAYSAERPTEIEE